MRIKRGYLSDMVVGVSVHARASSAKIVNGNTVGTAEWDRVTYFYVILIQKGPQK